MHTPARRRHGRVLLAAAAFVMAFSLATPAVLAQDRQAEPTDEDCEINDILVNSCRPWLGARASGYAEAGDSVGEQHTYHEERIGRNLDLIHTFAAAGQLPLSSEDEKELATRADTYLYQNWKPTTDWSKAGGDDDTVNEHIDAAAANIKAIGSKKLFLTIHHEPENDVSSDSSCDTNNGDAGTTAEYQQMWHNVRERFDAAGVDNVVWVMDYMNYSAWDCLVPKLYPGDEYVDWIMFNGYGTGDSPDFADNVDHFYQLLTELSGPEHDFTAKPWGIAEWGISDSTQEQAESYYDQAAATLDEGTFPRLKAYLAFDSPGTHSQGGLRVGYDDAGDKADPEQERYTEFAGNPAFG